MPLLSSSLSENFAMILLAWWSWASHLIFLYLSFLDFKEHYFIRLLWALSEPVYEKVTSTAYVPVNTFKFQRIIKRMSTTASILCLCCPLLLVPLHYFISPLHLGGNLLDNFIDLFSWKRLLSQFWIHEDFIDAAMSISVLDNTFISRLHRIRLHL